MNKLLMLIGEMIIGGLILFGGWYLFGKLLIKLGLMDNFK